jgi:hypothetical protein
MEDAAADPSADAIDIAPIAPTTPRTTTAAITKPKTKVKKEWSAAERKVQNQKCQDRRVAERTRKAEATTATEEEKWKCLILIHALAQVQEALKMRELLGEVRIDAVTGTTSSSSFTSQALQPPMLPRSPQTPRTTAFPGLHVHPPSRLERTRSSSLELRLLLDGIVPPAINLNLSPSDEEAPSGRAAGRYLARPCPVQ